MFDKGFRRYYIKCQETVQVYTSTECTVYTVTSSLTALHLQPCKWGCTYYRCPDISLLKRTVVNRKCLPLIGRSLEISLTVPLIQFNRKASWKGGNFKWLFIRRVRFLIHNGTLKTFVLLKKDWIILVFL